MSEWGLFSLSVAGIVVALVLAYVVLRDIRQGIHRPRSWLSWVGGAIVGLVLAVLAFMRAEA